MYLIKVEKHLCYVVQRGAEKIVIINSGNLWRFCYCSIPHSAFAYLIIEKIKLCRHAILANLMSQSKSAK